MSDYNQTQDRIIRAALDLFIEHGIKKTSLEDVANRCGLTRATVYRYYKDKKELVRASFFDMVNIVENTLNNLDKHSKLGTRNRPRW